MARPSLAQIERKWQIYDEAAATANMARSFEQRLSAEELSAKIRQADEAYAEYRDLVANTKAVSPLPKQH